MKNIMKSLTCDLYGHEAQEETFKEWMKALMPHYMKAHADVMKGKKGVSEEEKKETMNKWMADNKTLFDAI